MIEFFTSFSAYLWIALGLILLIAEILGAAGFLIGAAFAALGMAVVTWLFPELAFGWQLTLFAVSAIGATVLYFQVFRDAMDAAGGPAMNKRAQRLIGHQFELAEDIALGEAKVQIGDTLWKVKSAAPISKGTIVEVVDASRMSLTVSPK